MQKKMRTIGFASASIISTIATELLAGISKYIQKERNYTIRIIPRNELDDKSVFLGCDGVILDVPYTQCREIMKSLGIPFIDMQYTDDDPTIVHVDVDTPRAEVMAAEWFIRRGFRNFAFCGQPWSEDYAMHMDAFAGRLSGAGFGCRTFDCFVDRNGRPVKNRNIAKLTAALEKWIPTLPPRTAMLCCHDNRALRVVNACIRLGRAVPEDIAVMGEFNDITAYACSPVPITSIDMNMRKLGYAAMRILAHMIEHPCRPKPRRIFRVRPAGIVERASTAVYPIDPPWLADAMMLLDANLDRPVSLPDLAEAAGVSQTALQSAIRKTFGMSAAKYILSAKMREAKRLVEEGGYSVKEIAAMTGFSAANHFSRTYHAYYGRPPSKGFRPSPQ